jgi:hypothetical protein
MIHYVASGKIMNKGTETSNHMVLGISIRDAPSRAGNILYQTTTTPIPDILRPGEIADFSLAFSSDDLTSYGGLPLHGFSCLPEAMVVVKRCVYR